ncbi:MAG: TDT family transporter [Jatrophihabitans sp.]|uniref:SLAC1 family transporter n=1 Tax=Jatrophihabitans sp. TaxID=1932789 RepID=UPI003F8149A4
MTTILEPSSATIRVARPVPRRVTPNLFAISFGLAGLAQTWTNAVHVAGTPVAVADALWLLTGAVWLTTLAFYVRSLLTARRWRAELSDHVFGPFVSVPAIVGMLLAGGLQPHAPTAALALYWTSLVVALALAGHLLAVWALDDAPSTHWHPGYYLPSVGAPFVAAAEAVSFGHPSLAKLLFGIGALSWVLLGGILLHHLVGQERLPKPLLPTMAILLAPPVVAGNAWFAINGDHVDTVALGLAGYAALMIVTQFGLIPAYRTAPFGPGWWSFSFPYAATVGNALTWLVAAHVDHRRVLADLMLAALTAFIALLAVRTATALARRTFLPPAPVTAAADVAAAAAPRGVSSPEPRAAA